MTFRVEVFPRSHGGPSDSEASTIAAWRQELFADDQEIIDAFTWQNKNDMGFCIQTYSGSELIGFAHVFARVGRIDDSPVLMGCLGSVMTAREHQGAGVGSTTVRTAGEIILKSLQADLGVLVCKPAVVPFYERLGWRRNLVPVVIEQPAGSMQWPHESMVLLGENQKPAASKLDLRGFPF